MIRYKLVKSEKIFLAKTLRILRAGDTIEFSAFEKNSEVVCSYSEEHIALDALKHKKTEIKRFRKNNSEFIKVCEYRVDKVQYDKIDGVTDYLALSGLSMPTQEDLLLNNIEFRF